MDLGYSTNSFSDPCIHISKISKIFIELDMTKGGEGSLLEMGKSHILNESWVAHNQPLPLFLINPPFNLGLGLCKCLNIQPWSKPVPECPHIQKNHVCEMEIFTLKKIFSVQQIKKQQSQYHVQNGLDNVVGKGHGRWRFTEQCIQHFFHLPYSTRLCKFIYINQGIKIPATSRKQGFIFEWNIPRSPGLN